MRRAALVLVAVLTAAPALAQGAEQFVGRWGFVSYWNDADRAKSIAGARGSCGHPYVIARGPNGGAMMHAADAAAPSELRLVSANGKTYLVPPGTVEPGNRANRELIVVDANTFITRYTHDEAHGRYGMMVYARCGGGGANRR
ncbi:hypothetical protein [Phreatobacter stygius]|uniref:Lipocalin-like domain-containing protein n=1 Tax=Phreatobacter stygius TaxID=1940610 RepID=A0A4D7B7T7_9HYPH|nr:hypothetical protein [Phreatobacter stygius]QCI65696.1 hypothetical protein E8M01_16655 [Phreatobacter stygius]